MVTTQEHLDMIYEEGRDLRLAKLDGKPIRCIDDWGFEGGKWYVIGEEFGPRVLVHAKSESDAWEAFIDEEPTIDPDEVYEAYGCDTPEELTSSMGEDLELIEGHEYQSNASGTGIVSVSHHAFLWECQIDRLSFRSQK